MPDWPAPLECPKYGSTDTRFVELHYEMPIYECDVCGCQFKVEGDE